MAKSVALVDYRWHHRLCRWSDGFYNHGVSVDMDGKRIDKALVNAAPSNTAADLADADVSLSSQHGNDKTTNSKT